MTRKNRILITSGVLVASSIGLRFTPNDLQVIRAIIAIIWVLAGFGLAMSIAHKQK